MSGILTSKHKAEIWKNVMSTEKESDTAENREDSLKIFEVTWAFLVHEGKLVRCCHREKTWKSSFALFPPFYFLTSMIRKEISLL